MLLNGSWLKRQLEYEEQSEFVYLRKLFVCYDFCLFLAGKKLRTNKKQQLEKASPPLEALLHIFLHMMTAGLSLA